MTPADTIREALQRREGSLIITDRPDALAALTELEADRDRLAGTLREDWFAMHDDIRCAFNVRMRVAA
jgi:hypothetical protein